MPRASRALPPAPTADGSVGNVEASSSAGCGKPFQEPNSEKMSAGRTFGRAAGRMAAEPMPLSMCPSSAWSASCSGSPSSPVVTTGRGTWLHDSLFGPCMAPEDAKIKASTARTGILGMLSCVGRPGAFVVPVPLISKFAIDKDEKKHPGTHRTKLATARQPREERAKEWQTRRWSADRRTQCTRSLQSRTADLAACSSSFRRDVRVGCGRACVFCCKCALAYVCAGDGF